MLGLPVSVASNAMIKIDKAIIHDLYRKETSWEINSSALSKHLNFNNFSLHIDSFGYVEFRVKSFLFGNLAKRRDG